jgi:hypothetical protein
MTSFMSKQPRQRLNFKARATACTTRLAIRHEQGTNRLEKAVT